MHRMKAEKYKYSGGVSNMFWVDCRVFEKKQ